MKNKILVLIGIIIVVTIVILAFISLKKDDNVTKIGIIQFAKHSSLDDCYRGIIDGLAEYGYIDEKKDIKIEYENAFGEQQNSDLIAQNMVQKKYDIIFTIATPAAMSAYSASKETEIPVVFTAVTDPISAGIAKSIEHPGLGVTGTSDVIDYDQQLQMIRDFMPSAKKIGIIYTLSEANAVSNLNTITNKASEYNFEIITQGITNASEISNGAETLINKGVECFCLLTDNNIADNLSTLLNITNNKKIPVFARDNTQVDAGCIATLAINYYELGKNTADMGVKILKHEEKANDLSIEVIDEYEVIYNKEKCLDFNIEIPEKYKNK